MGSFYPKVQASRLGTVQTITLSGASAAIANPLGPETFQIAIVSTAACNIVVDTGTPTASAANFLLPANTILYLIAGPGQKVAAFGASGTVYVAELS
jgi:hypothetical protein